MLTGERQALYMHAVLQGPIWLKSLNRTVLTAVLLLATALIIYILVYSVLYYHCCHLIVCLVFLHVQAHLQIRSTLDYEACMSLLMVSMKCLQQIVEYY